MRQSKESARIEGRGGGGGKDEGRGRVGWQRNVLSEDRVSEGDVLLFLRVQLSPNGGVFEAIQWQSERVGYVLNSVV